MNFRTKLASVLRALVGLRSKPANKPKPAKTYTESEKTYARNYTLAYVSVLLGGGIALSFG